MGAVTLWAKHIVAAALLAGAAGLGSAASASVEVSYTFTSPYTISNVINYNRYTDGSGGFSSGGGRENYAPGVNTLTQGGIGKAIASTYLMGTTSLGTTSPNHLIIALNDGFASSAVGREFSTVFGARYLDDSMFEEQDVVGALQSLYNPGSDDDARGAAVTTIFKFSDLVVADGGSFAASGTPFTLVGFSAGQVAGSGTANATGTPDGTPGPAAVPEASAWAMMIVGFGAIGGRMRRRRAGQLAAAHA